MLTVKLSAFEYFSVRNLSYHDPEPRNILSPAVSTPGTPSLHFTHTPEYYVPYVSVVFYSMTGDFFDIVCRVIVGRAMRKRRPSGRTVSW